MWYVPAACAWQPGWVQSKSQEGTFVRDLVDLPSCTRRKRGCAVLETGWNTKDEVFSAVLKIIVLESHVETRAKAVILRQTHRR